MRLITYLIFLLVLVIGITFSYLNPTLVVFNYYIDVKIVPVSLLMTISFGVGIMLSFLANLVIFLRFKTKNYYLKKQLKDSEQRLSELMNPSK